MRGRRANGPGAAGPNRASPGRAARRWLQLAGVALACAVVVGPSAAAARSVAALPYESSHVWATAVRFLRVDRNLPIREKDEAAGYVLFDYTEAGKSYRAALELVPFTDEGGRVTTQVSLSITGLPRRYEGALLDGLAAKIRDERGAPPAAPSAASRRSGARGDAEPERERPHERDKDRDRDGAKGASPPDAGGLPRIPTLPLR